MSDNSISRPHQDVSFDTIKLYPGAIMQMQSMLDDTQERHEVKFVGVIKNQSLLVTLPVIDGSCMWMQTKQRHIFRGFNGQYAYAFTSQVIRARTHPFSYAHFTYPENVEYRLVRHSLRVPVSLTGIITAKQRNNPIPVELLDLSTLGAMLASSEQLGKIGDEVQMSLNLSADDNVANLTIPCSIRSITEGHIGIKFERVSSNDILILHFYISSLLLSV